MKLSRLKLKEIIREELLKEDDYATQYIDMIDDITKEVTRKSSKIVKLLNKQDKITGTQNARIYNQAVDKHFRNFIAATMKITAKIEELNERKEIGGYYLMKMLKDMAHDSKRSGERKVAKALMYLHDRINQSSRDMDLNAGDLNDFLNDPRGRKHARDLPDWLIDSLFEGTKRKR